MSKSTIRPSFTPARPTPQVSMIVRPSASASWGEIELKSLGQETTAISARVRSRMAATIAWAWSIVACFQTRARS